MGDRDRVAVESVQLVHCRGRALNSFVSVLITSALFALGLPVVLL